MVGEAGMRAWKWIGVLGVVTAHAAEPPLVLHYHTRPPLYYQTDGVMHGLMAEPLERALSAARIAHRWEDTPFNRAMALIKARQGQDCGVGWMYTTERAAFGRYSAPLYRSQPMVALVSNKVSLASGGPVEALLGNSGYVLVVRENFSYGRELDERLQALPHRLASTEPLPQLARMLERGIADYMFVDQEEAAGLLRPGLRMLRFSNLAGEQHYLFCSLAVPAKRMDEVNRAMWQLK